jgi:peptide/nickel transport system permease protein
MGLKTFIIRRIIISVFLILGVLTVNFILFMLMPGDPVDLFIPPRGISSEQYEKMVAAFKETWGLNDPIHIQYLKYIVRMFTWNFGDAIRDRRPVVDHILVRLPWTIWLMATSTIAAIIIGVSLGVIAASKRGSIFDTTCVSTSLMLNSLPVFWIGLVLILIFAQILGWLPTGKTYPDEWAVNWPKPFSIVVDHSSTGTLITTLNLNLPETSRMILGYLQHLILPFSVLTLFQFGGYLLLTRATMLESLTEDYIITARAKGLPEKDVLFKHALKNASLPIITSVALSFGFMFSGAIITETIFSWYGMGRFIYEVTAETQDYFCMQAVFYITSLTVIIANIIADLLYGVIDPRIKYG